MNKTGRTTRYLALAAIAAGLWLVACQSTALTSGKVYMQQEEWDRAAEQLQLAVEATPGDAEAWKLLGLAKGHLGEFVDAGRAFARAVEDPEQQEEAARMRRTFWVREFNRGIDAINSEQFEIAVTAFANAVAIDSTNSDAARNLGYSHYELDQIDRAIAVYEQILERVPDDEDTAVRLGYLYYNEENYEKAAHYLKGPAAHTDDVQIVSALATSYQLAGNDADALALLQRARAEGPNSAALLLELGQYSWQDKNFEDAAAIYLEAMEMEPDNADATHNRAMALLELKRDDEAYDVLLKTVELNNQMGDAWYWLGVVYARRNMVSESEDAFKRAAELGVE